MKPFELYRHEDETGVSGTGHIASGVEFDDGTCVLRWRTETPGTTIYASVEHMLRVHGHNGKTEMRYVHSATKTKPVMDDAVLDHVRATIHDAIAKCPQTELRKADEQIADAVVKVLDAYVRRKGANDVRDWTMWFMCSMCLAHDEIDGHCLNCGAGGTTHLVPMWFIESIRKNASWVCKRYYPNEEDMQNAGELRALRAQMATFPGRSAELVKEDERGAAYWRVKQATGDRTYTMVTTPWLGEDDTAEKAVDRTKHVLPWNPSESWKPREPKPPNVEVKVTRMT
jgi:hypothetical protein